MAVECARDWFECIEYTFESIKCRFPFNQWTVEDAWSSFSFDVGMSFFTKQSRTLNVTKPFNDRVVLLPAPFTPVIKKLASTSNSNIFTTKDEQAHGLSPGSLSAFPRGSIRVLGMKDGEFHEFNVISVPNSKEIEVSENASSQDGLLCVAAAGARSFSTSEQLVDVLNAFCSRPLPEYRDLRRLHFEYDRITMELSLTALSDTNPHDKCEHFVFDTREESILDTLGFSFSSARELRLPERLVSIGFPRQSLTVTIPPGNYEPHTLRPVVDALLSSDLYLTIGSSRNALLVEVKIFTWNPDAIPQGESDTSTETCYTITFKDWTYVGHHPSGTANWLTKQFRHNDDTSIEWTFEDDCFVARDISGKFFRIEWPTNGEMSLFLPHRLGIDEITSMTRELKGRPRHYFPLPTRVSIPGAFQDQAISQRKQFVIDAKPRVQTMCSHSAQRIQTTFNDRFLCVEIGAFPMEWPLLVRRAKIAGYYAFGCVVGHWSMEECHRRGITDIPLFGDKKCGITAIDVFQRIEDLDDYYVEPIPLTNAAVNLYFPTPSLAGWNRLAEILGFQNGANLWHNPLIAPAQWNFDQPSYVLLDLGLQHVSATISHRCGDNVLSQFFGKIVLYPPFKEQRMTPVQAIGTGVSVVSSLHFRILNPWHQLYELHGRNWSITVILASSTKGGRTECA